MFDQLFEHPFALARYRTGPFVKERIAFLAHLASQEYPRRTLREKARGLLAIAHSLGSARWSRKALAIDEIASIVGKQPPHFLLAVRWLQFMGRLRQYPVPLTPYTRKIFAFANYMANV
jgi:hypothetical protein